MNPHEIAHALEPSRPEIRRSPAALSAPLLLTVPLLAGLLLATTACDKGQETAPTATTSPATTSPATTSAPTSVALPSAPLPSAATSAPEPTPSKEPEPPPTEPELADVNARYSVVSVVEGDFLNVRAETDGKSAKVGALKPNGKDIRLTGNHETKDDASVWVEVDLAGKKGWVNRYHLAEQPTRDVCMDHRVRPLLTRLAQAIKAKDGEGLAQIASPARGLMLRYGPKEKTVLFRAVHQSPSFQLGRFFEKKSDKHPYEWTDAKSEMGSIKGTIEESILPTLKAAAIGSKSCGALPGSEWPADLAGLAPYSLRGATERGEEVVWIAGIEYVGGRPFLAALVRYR